MNTLIPAQLDEFIKESNAIEGVYDMDSFADAKFAMMWLLKQKMITIPVILHTHKLLMERQNLETRYVGHFRNQSVWIGGKEILYYSIQSSINEWCERMNEVEADPKQLHIEYEKLHPFIDGNGRTGRMFMNWLRVKQGLPLLVIKESEKFAYYKWFQ